MESFTAVIRMDDIILSREETHTSAQNHFRGSVLEIIHHYYNLYRVVLDCGFRLTATVTEKSIEDLGLSTGVSVFVTFKASAVRLY
jgi:molybdopterin-binding protein